MTKEAYKQLAAKFSEGMSLQDYMDINELIRERGCVPKEEFYSIDIIPYYGIEPNRMMFTHYFPDYDSRVRWFGDVCVVLQGGIIDFTILLKDGEMKSGWKEGWRIVKDVNLPRKETYSDNRYKKLP
jgi:hypothetical protein